MSLSYTLEIAGQTKSGELTKLLCSLAEYHQSAEGIIAPGLLIQIGQPNPLESEMIEEEFGFSPAASVIFWRDKESDPVATRTSLLRGCVALLQGSAGDAVLLFNGETVILLRRNGRLALNPLEGFWTDEALALIPKPFEFESIPSN